MTRDGLLGLVVVTLFTLTSAVVFAAGTPKPGATKPAPAKPGVNQNRADAIGKSCEDFQKKMEDYCKKEAPKQKKMLEEAKKKLKAGETWKQENCDETKTTPAGAKKLCGNQERFVHKQTRYGIEYEYSCNYEGKLSDNNRLAPHFRVDVATGKTSPTNGKGYCVDDYRVRDLFKDKKNCAQTGDGTGYGTRTSISEKNTCKGGTVQFSGNFSSELVAKLDKQFKCFQSVEKKGVAPDKKTIGDKISGFYSGKEDADGKVIIVCRDDQKELEDELKSQMKWGDIAYDKEKKEYKPSGALTDEEIKAAKESLKAAGSDTPQAAFKAQDSKKELELAERDDKKATGVLKDARSELARLKEAGASQEKIEAAERRVEQAREAAKEALKDTLYVQKRFEKSYYDTVMGPLEDATDIARDAYRADRSNAALEAAYVEADRKEALALAEMHKRLGIYRHYTEDGKIYGLNNTYFTYFADTPTTYESSAHTASVCAYDPSRCTGSGTSLRLIPWNEFYTTVYRPASPKKK